MALATLLILGVRLEYGPNQEGNNTLITVLVNGTKGDERALFCSTDRRNCCNDELNLPGNWFLPNGSEISSSTNTQSLHITLGNQTMGLNISPESPSGIYHCEMMDRENIAHHLYAGIYAEGEGTYVMHYRIILLLVIVHEQVNFNNRKCG